MTQIEIIHICTAIEGIRKGHALRHTALPIILLTLYQTASISVSNMQTTVHLQYQNNNLLLIYFFQVHKAEILKNIREL